MWACAKALNDVLEECHEARVEDMFAQQANEDGVIYVLKELFDITLQDPGGVGMVFACLVSKGAETIEGFMDAFADAAEIDIRNETPVKIGIQHPVDRMVEHAVADRCFMDTSRFGISNGEGMVGAVGVGVVLQIFVE